MSETFQKLEKIGEGTYGVVYKAKERRTGQIVALKKIRLENESEGIPHTTIREVFLLKNLKHSTIINLYDVIYSNDKMYLVFEYAEMDLRQYLDKFVQSNMVVDKVTLKTMVHQLMTAIYFCHSKNVFHRDLKPQNILVDKCGNLKLADFGLGRLASVPLRSYTSEVVTLWYRPPELLLGSKYYDASVDIWSAACIIAEIICLGPIFSGDSEVDQLFKIFKVLGTPNNTVWSGVEQLPNFLESFPKYEPYGIRKLLDADVDLLEILEQMLVYTPLHRLSAKEALSKKYFDGMKPITK